MAHIAAHLTLFISPSIVDLQQPLTQYAGIWFTMSDLQNLAVPAAIKNSTTVHP